MDRALFNEQNNCWLEEAKLMQVEGETGILADIKGVAVEYEDGRSKPELEIRHTRTVKMNSKVLTSDETTYKNHVRSDALLAPPPPPRLLAKTAACSEFLKLFRASFSRCLTIFAGPANRTSIRPASPHLIQ